MSSRLKEQYQSEIVEALKKKFEYKNIMEVPKLDKIVINMGVGEAKENAKVLDSAVKDLETITGQKVVLTRAKNSVANFKIREGMPIGCKTTLRGEKMYDFMDRLVNLALPRVRDFRGVSADSFDGRGNYALGVKEQLIFPEIEYDKVEKVRGMDVIVVTTAKTDEEARELLSLFGMGINVGIDFSGGMSMQYTMGEAVTQSDIEGVLNGIGLKDYAVSVQGTGKDSINIRIKAIDEDGVQGVQASITEALQAKYPNAAIYGDVNYVGPVAGATLLRNAFLSVLIAALCMLIYIAIRFDFNSGAAAVLGLVHDVLIMLSFMVILRSFVQMNSSFIAAMLTIVGYSINNTIIIFDRIRENARKMPSSTPRVDVVNRSIKECLGRTINTTLTTLVTIVCLYIFGVSSIREFALPIIVGIISGVYSANMINGYVWAFLEEKKRAKKAAKA